MTTRDRMTPEGRLVRLETWSKQHSNSISELKGDLRTGVAGINATLARMSENLGELRSITNEVRRLERERAVMDDDLTELNTVINEVRDKVTNNSARLEERWKMTLRVAALAGASFALIFEALMKLF